MPTSGRTGLDAIDVTPAVFLQLRDQLKDGRKLPFNENQLLIAFSRYLRDAKGPWKRADIKQVKDLHKFAESYVAKHTKKLEDKFGPKAQQPKTHQQASAKQQQAEKFIDAHGLKLLDDKQIPKGETANDKSSSLMTEKNAEHAADATEIVAELFSIAQSADPGVAVAAVLLSHALLPNMSSMAIRGTHLLLEKFEHRTDTAQEKDIVLHGLEIVTANILPNHYNQEMLRIQAKESSNPKADPEHLARLEKIKGDAVQKDIQDKRRLEDFKNTNALFLAFHQNLESLDLMREEIMKRRHERALARVEQEEKPGPFAPPSIPGLTLDLSKGPKPPTEEIFGRRRHDETDHS